MKVTVRKMIGNDVELIVDAVYSRGRPATREDPEEGPEVDWDNVIIDGVAVADGQDMEEMLALHVGEDGVQAVIDAVDAEVEREATERMRSEDVRCLEADE